MEASGTSMKNLEKTYETVRELAACKAVVVFSMSDCSMCTVAKCLLYDLGVGPAIIELDHHSAGADIHSALFRLSSATTADPSDSQRQPVPAVFIGGKFLGGIETLIAFHIKGTLVPLLKDAGAIWL